MIAVLRAGGLGDVLLTLPALRLLRPSAGVFHGLRGPRPALEVVGYPAFWRATGPAVDRVLPIDDWRFAGLYTEEPERELRRWLSGQMRLVAWTARPLGGWVAGAVPRLIQASPHPPPGMHAADWLLGTLAPLCESRPCVEPAEGWLGLTPMEQALGRARLAERGLQRPALIHPGAGAAWKRWPATSFARLVRGLQARGHQVALVEGPADEEPVRAVLQETGTLPVIREPDLRALGQMLSQAGVFAGNDAGVTHLAAMAGAPTIALFGPTDPASWAPLGNVRVIRRCRRRAARQNQIRVCADAECLAAITAEEVLEVIDIAC